MTDKKAMNKSLKYSQSLRAYLNDRNTPAAAIDILGWVGTLSDAELSEFGHMVRMATRGKPTEDIARFAAAAMPGQHAGTQDAAPTKKILERFLVSTYSNIVMERKERLQLLGKHVRKPNGKSACSCCSHE